MTITDRLQYFQKLEATSPAKDSSPSSATPTSATTATTSAATNNATDEFVSLKERLRRYEASSSAASIVPTPKPTTTTTSRAIERPFERANNVAASVPKTTAAAAARPTATARAPIVNSVARHDDSAHIRSGSAAAAGTVNAYTSSVSSSGGNVSSSAAPVKPLAASKASSGSQGNLASGGKKCELCAKTVYFMEEISLDNKYFHKTCLKCTHCHSTLRLGNLAAMNGNYYCKPHFKELFRLKGNYSEGFGAEDPKKAWISRNTEEATRPTPAATVAAGRASISSASNSSPTTTINSITSPRAAESDSSNTSLKDRLQKYNEMANTTAETPATASRRSVGARESISTPSAYVAPRKSIATTSGYVRNSVAARKSVSHEQPITVGSVRASVAAREGTPIRESTTVNVRASVAARESMSTRASVSERPHNTTTRTSVSERISTINNNNSNELAHHQSEFRRESSTQTALEREEARLTRHVSLNKGVNRGRNSVAGSSPAVRVEETIVEPRSSVAAAINDAETVGARSEASTLFREDVAEQVVAEQAEQQEEQQQQEVEEQQQQQVEEEQL
ncbi:hypothetical protein SmJEL517_g00699 [Synchytrium microbalum]|uniref:LIM zinc-binding domain-containing protein n=1 Tax=Synchytrium microbalum TaxID=1806994 RepID=A0A507C981_9FUNG|nr:uncharacterized protein SmJEL517_g00699 [Synchytrium microbalum]TPX37627.1 hypothetical protein SmJEL517_g00699 [Synchytrium microbalum]